MQRDRKSSSKQETRGDNNNYCLLLSPGSMCLPYAGQASFCISRIQQHSAQIYLVTPCVYQSVFSSVHIATSRTERTTELEETYYANQQPCVPINMP